MAIMTLVGVALGLVSLCHVALAADPPVTGTYKLTSPGKCEISLKSFGMQDNGPGMIKSSYITVNGLTYVDTKGPNFGLRGFNIVTLDPVTCKASNFGHFDTWEKPTDSNLLVDYINKLPDGAQILGVTSDDAFERLQPNAKDALKSIGVDTTGLVYADKILFHAVKGHPEKTVEKIGKKGTENLFYEEKPEPCDFCLNGGTLKINADGSGFECQCIGIFGGLYCQDFSKDKCVAFFNEHQTPAKVSKRQVRK